MKIVANMATYPPRREGAINAIRQLAPQFDRLNLVLNEYDAPIDELADLPNVHQLLPEQDTKDTGKFYPAAKDADFLFYVDDDILYPADFAERTVSLFQGFGAGFLGGYHGSLYRSRGNYLRRGKLLTALSYDKARIADYRKVFHFQRGLDAPVVVDQIATCAAIIRGEDAPPFEFMRDSQKFVDVRLARWCHERGITPVALPKAAKWLEKVDYDETIFRGFTQKNPPAVTEEILSFAFKTPGRGQAPQPAPS